MNDSAQIGPRPSEDESDPSAAALSGSFPRWLASVIILVLASLACVIWIGRSGGGFQATQPLPAGPVVCIDPGHPTTYSSGRQVSNGLRELDINWEVALKLESLLRENYGYRVVMTRRDKDLLMNNAERADVANDSHARLFLRLHCDAGANHGFTLYYPDRQGEDRGVTGPSASVIESSRRAAYALHAGMADSLDGVLKDRGVKSERFTKVGRSQGALTGSIFSQVPVVTVEMVFLTSRYDAQFIRTDQGQWRMAKALANGVAKCMAAPDSPTNHP